MFGRQVVLSLRGPIRLTSTNKLSSQQHVRAAWSILSQTQRFYATPGRPRSTVGEPSRTVKRDVKRSAKPAAKGAAKKPAATKKKKKKAVKPKPKPKKKELTEAEQEAKKAKTEKAKIAALKKLALNPPKARKLNSWHVFLMEKTRSQPQVITGSATALVAQQYKALSPAELEHYNHLAVELSEKRAADYAAYVKSYSVEDIAKANNARLQLRRKTGNKIKYSIIKDSRRPKKTPTAFILFSVARNASGDMANIKVSERAKLIASEWKELSASEKATYQEASRSGRT